MSESMLSVAAATTTTHEMHAQTTREIAAEQAEADCEFAAKYKDLKSNMLALEEEIVELKANSAKNAQAIEELQQCKVDKATAEAEKAKAEADKKNMEGLLHKANESIASLKNANRLKQMEEQANRDRTDRNDWKRSLANLVDKHKATFDRFDRMYEDSRAEVKAGMQDVSRAIADLAKDV
ncbi:hypothetical protein H9P43_004277 [Blastocladiella emersonii ATCC 22665]|nr:hypothetical protein H9P43_004277 [Blastocladiella emersonii ATCC 22665]